MKFLFILMLISFSGFSQKNTSVIITPVLNVNLDSNTSYVYCSTMELMWNELIEYLGEMPKSSNKNSTIDLMNKSISKNYQKPIEEEYVVSHFGSVKDSIVQIINSDLEHKFNTSWNPSFGLSENSLVGYSHLKKEVSFYYFLNDIFYNQPFNNKINIDYFGIKEGNPLRNSEHVLVHDFKNVDDFIIQVKCGDSLDEIFFAKIPMEATLLKSYQKVINRVNSKKTEILNGGDRLTIPYIKFDTTTHYINLEGLLLTNDLLEGKSIQNVSQRISFDMNQQGIKLESSAQSIIEYVDYNNPDPRILAFDKPFLIFLKRKDSNRPYFMYWVSGEEFMRSYILKSREIETHETAIVGKWKYSKRILWDGTETVETSENQFIEFYNDGTFTIFRTPSDLKGQWRFNPDNKIIELTFLSSNKSGEKVEWILDDINSDRFIIGGKTKLIYEKINNTSEH